MAVQIQLRRDTAANWTSANPVLAQGEVGIELDTYKFKWGDGVSTWNALSYFGGGVSIGDVVGLTAALAGKVDDSQITSFMLTLLDDTDAITARATLGLGTAATTASTAYAPAAHVGAGGTEHAVATGTTSGFMAAADKVKLDALSNYTSFKGVFADLAALQTAFPTGTTGDWAHISNPAGAAHIAVWATDSASWDEVGEAVTAPGTNISVTVAPTSVTIVSDTGADGTIPAADPTNAGVMSAADKTKLNGIGTGASVSTVSVATANGFAGTVATPSATPAITMTVTFSGLAKANGTSLSAATAGTDYSLGTSALGTGILKSTTGTGALTVAVPGDFPLLNQSTTGTAASVTGTNVVANTNLAQMPANTFKANNTGATANVADITPAQAKTLLAIAAADVSGLGALATQATVNLSTQATGVLQASQEPAHTGDVTNTAGSLALAIGAGVVTNAKLATVATATLKGRTTAGTGAPEDLTPAQAKTLLAIVAADLSDFAATVRATVLTGLSVATNAAITATDSVLVAFGKLQAQITGHFGVGGATHPDVVAAGASGFMSGADKTKLNGVATGATANSPDATLLARANHTGTQTLATISDVTVTAANLNTLDDGANTALHFHDADRARANHTGTQTAATISDFSAAADARIGVASINALADVVITAPSTGQVVKFNGTNWVNDADATGGGGVTDGDKGDITVSAGGTVWTIDAGSVTLTDMANLAATSIIGNNTGAGATPIALTPAQVTAMLDAFTSTLKGLVPLSGGGTTNFLRADGTWAAAGGGSPVEVSDEGSLLTAGAASLNFVGAGVTATNVGAAVTITIAGGGGGSGITLAKAYALKTGNFIP